MDLPIDAVNLVDPMLAGRQTVPGLEASRADAQAQAQAWSEGSVPLQSILCTDELHLRVHRPADYATENRVLVALAQALADSPSTILQTLVEKILEVFQAGSAGISVLTKDGKRFVWPAVAGAWKAHVGEGTPRDFGPCGDVLDCNAPLLLQHVERRYPYLLADTPPAVECLLLPFYAQGKAVGTIWAIYHDDRRKFDAEDLRQLEGLGRFASAAHQTATALQDAFAQRSAALDLLENAERSRDAMKTLNLELRASEEFNRSIVESSPDCIKILDLEGNLLAILGQGPELLGIEDIQSVLNTSWVDLWRAEDQPPARAAVKVAAAGGEGNFVGLFRKRRAERTWWDVSISPILDVNMKPARLLAVSRDVTRRKHTEMNLEFLASVSHDLLRWTNVDEMMQTVGTKMAAYLGLSICAFVEVDEAADQGVISHDWHRDDVPSLVGVHRLGDFVEAEFIETARSGTTIVVRDTATDRRTGSEKFAVFKIASFVCVPLIEDGQWRFALCLYHSEPYEWRDDEIALAGELMERIWTRLQRLRTEEALRVSEARFRVLFDGGPIAIYSCDASGLILEFNRRAVDLWGREPVQQSTGELSCGAWKLYLPDGTLLTLEQTPMAKVLSGKIPVANDVEVVIERPDGSRISVIANIVPLKNKRGEISGAINYFYDITERSRLEKTTREQAHELADQGRRKDEFLAMLGHELRNPLAPISNAIHLLRLRQNEDPVQIKACGIIERQLGQLTLLVDDLLEVSRITTGKVHLNEERLVLAKVVENAVETVRQMILQRRHALALSMPEQAIWLYADAARLEQVLVNLLTNAAKYTDPGGSIWLSIELQGDEAVLKVRDSGIGIAPELLPRVFDIFAQGERSLDRSQGGLGIGLTVVRRLVEMQRGTVEAHSVVGQGSEFVVRLPAVQAVAQPASTVTEMPMRPARSLRVLVVEDNVDSAESLCMLLKAYGQDVRLAHEGAASLKMALDFQPDVVLLDIGLPGMSGYEIAERIREQPGLRNVVLVAVTGYGEAAARQRSRTAGFDHHLVKPADFQKLQEILASVPTHAPDKRGPQDTR